VDHPGPIELQEYANTFGPGVILNYTHNNLGREGSRLGINNHVGADLYYKTATIKLAENIKEVLPELEDLENYPPLGKKVSLNSEFAMGLSDNIKPFPDNYLKGKLGVQVQPIPKLFVSTLANLIFVTDDISTLLNDIFTWNDDARYIGAGAGFTYKTPIGPISIYFGSRIDIWNPIWYFNIGHTF